MRPAGACRMQQAGSAVAPVVVVYQNELNAGRVLGSSCCRQRMMIFLARSGKQAVLQHTHFLFGEVLVSMAGTWK